MKRSILIIISLILGFGAIRAQQSVNVVKGNVAYSFDALTTGLMNYSEGKILTILGNQFNLSEIDKVTVKNMVVENNSVLVEYNGESAFVSIAGNLTDYVSATVSGAHVEINQNSNVGDNTCGEITYILKGSTENGSFILNGSYKATIELQGVSITNPSGAAIDIENGKRIELSAKNGTINTLVDQTDGEQKGTIYCKGHLELKGKGELNITGNTSHAIASKEYVEMKNLTLNILGAEKDGINCTQYFLFESGTLNITGVKGDGVQVDFKDSEGKRDAEDTGSITIEGGEIYINISGTASKGLKCEGDFSISDGKVTIENSGPGEWDSKNEKTKASACIAPDGNVTIKGGVLSLKASGGGGKGITCDGELIIDAGEIDITTTGGALVYYNGTLSQNYTGNMERIPSDSKSSPKGIKSEGNITINNGTIFVSTQGNNGEGIESKSSLTINDGDITVRAKDDGINSADDMVINGGSINVIATANDGLDSNGNIIINGGVIMAFGAGGVECGIDANDEEGYTVILNGGYLLAVGGRNSVPSSTSGSVQPYVSTSGSITGGTAIVIAKGEEDLFTFTVPEDYTMSSGGNGPGGGNGGWGPGGNSGSFTIMISTPDLVSGETYKVINGNTSSDATARVTGNSGGGWRP